VSGGGPHRRAWLGLIALVAVAAAAVGVLVTMSSPGPQPTRSTVATSTAPRPPAPIAPALPAPAGRQFGVNVNLLFNTSAYTQAEIDAQLGAARAAGATMARSDALWEATEPQPPAGGRHAYDWTFDDRIAGSLAAHGLGWLAILDYTAPWAQSVPGQDHSPPRNDADYAAYAAAFVARYGPGGTFWRDNPGLTAAPVTTIEIWNEPDNGAFWVPAPDAAAYAALYLAARTAIDAVDPAIRVIVGGLTDPTAFLPAMITAAPQLRGHVDGVAIHPYGTPATVIGRVRAARATLVALGMGGVPLYVTEFGWTTSPAGAVDYAPEARRPGYITQTLTELGHLDCALAASVLYTWVSPESDPTDSQDWYGIANPRVAGAPTPGTAAFAAGVRAAGQPATGPAAEAACPG
jgi:hypothetical protein